jgi:hypothetical protein
LSGERLEADDRSLVVRMCRCNSPDTVICCHNQCLQRVVDRLSKFGERRPISIKCENCQAIYEKQIPRISWRLVRTLMSVAWMYFSMMLLPMYLIKLGWDYFPERHFALQTAIHECDMTAQNGLCPADQRMSLIGQFYNYTTWWPGLLHHVASLLIWMVVMGVVKIFKYMARLLGFSATLDY